MNIVISVAAVLLLIIGIIYVYVTTRPAPPPITIPTSPCDSCVPPQVCISGVCSDIQLPGLLNNAQAAASGMYRGLNDVSSFVASTLTPTLTAINNSFAGSSTLPPTFGGVQAELSKSSEAIAKYIGKTLAVPGCDASAPASSGKCGYYSDIDVLTTTSQQPDFYTVTMGANSVPVELISVTSQLTSLSETVAAYLQSVATFAQTNTFMGSQYKFQFDTALPLAQQHLITLNKFIPYLNSLATLVKKTGYELYSHFI